jgi:hypothetical protein
VGTEVTGALKVKGEVVSAHILMPAERRRQPDNGYQFKSVSIFVDMWKVSHFKSRGASLHKNALIVRSYARTAALLDEEAAPAKRIDPKVALEQKLAARDFNSRRAAYNRQVSVLRREYGEEVAKQRAQDKAEQEALERETTRRRLERQRKKNIRSAANAIRQEEIRRQTEREFNEHLEVMQRQRDAKNKTFAKARQLIVDEFEEEAPLWLTTVEEVDAAFTPEAEQLLWSRPGGVLGVPNPSMDCHFWQYETHTWHMDKTYKSQREALLEELEETAYDEANIDKSFWTKERLAEQEKLEEKARLRAMVQSAGVTELLRRQKSMIEDQFSNVEGEIQKAVPAPNMKMLRDNEALEREGARLLMDDPTKFFVFEKSSHDDYENDEDPSSYSGPTLGAPTGLRDRLREGSHQNSVFPEMIGKFPKPDMRTEREKKQQEREEKMWAAAQAEADSGDADVDIAAQREEDLTPDINYDELEDSDDEEWERGLDPVSDTEIMNTPHERRYTEGDIDWVLERLEGKVKHFEQQCIQDVESLKQVIESELRSVETKSGSIDAAILALSASELLALSDLDDLYVDGKISDEELAVAAKDIPGLTEEQLKEVLERSR